MKVKTAIFFALVFGFFLAVCMTLTGCGVQVTDGVPVDGVLFLVCVAGMCATTVITILTTTVCKHWWHIYLICFLASIALLATTSCGPKCAPAFPTVGNYEGEPGHYSFHATNRLSSGVLLETSRPWLVDEIDQVVSETIACATAIGPTLTKEEMDFDHGFCIAHMARNLWCDVDECLKVKITEDFHVSKIDGVALLLNDVAGDADSCHPKPDMDPEAPFYWAGGNQYDGVVVSPPPSRELFDEDGVYGRWGGLRRALIDYVLGCYNSPLVERLQPCLNGMVVDARE